jgi:hypothetical protein
MLNAMLPSPFLESLPPLFLLTFRIIFCWFENSCANAEVEQEEGNFSCAVPPFGFSTARVPGLSHVPLASTLLSWRLVDIRTSAFVVHHCPAP